VSLTVRSYRRVFRVDRRIFRIPNTNWVLPVPGGVPLSALGYFAGAFLAMFFLGRVPLVGAAVGALSPPLRFVIVPLAVAMLLSRAAPDGRGAHRYVAAWLGLRLRSRRRSLGRVVALEGEPVAWQAELPLRGDGSEPDLRRARISGPARLRFAEPIAVRPGRRRRAVARPASAEEGRPATTLVRLAEGETLEVRP